MELERLAEIENRQLRDRPAERLALWRALVTAGLEAFVEGMRDSDGAVASYLGEALEVYVKLPWREAGIDQATHYADLCELCVWEDYGLLYRRELVPYRRVRQAELDLVEHHLWKVEAELKAMHLDSYAEQAAQQVGYLVAATKAFDRFVPTAGRLGCDWWMPITAMGQAAVDAGRVDLARKTFEAATSHPGAQHDYLVRKCEELTGKQGARRERLHVVKEEPPFQS
jgi:hypothetical protein